MPPLDRFDFDGAARALAQAVGPGMIGLGEAVPDPATPTELGERMPLGGAGPAPTAIAPQGALPPVVGQHPIEAEGIEPLTVREEGDRTGHVSCRGDLHRHQARGSVDGHKEIPPGPAQTGQRKGIDVQNPGRTGTEATVRWDRVGPQQSEAMQLQPDQFSIDGRTTELWEDGLPQG